MNSYEQQQHDVQTQQQQTAAIPASSGLGQAERQHFNRTQIGNAERLIDRHGHNLRYCHPWRSWLIWNGKQWKPDNTKAIYGLAKETIRSVYREVANTNEEDVRKALASHAARSERLSEIEAMITLAQDKVAIGPDSLDQNPFLFNCQNGTVDLNCGKLDKHRPARMLSKISPVLYDGYAECPIWLAFLKRIFANDKELVSFMQRAIGYALTGSVTEKAMFVLHGDGDNGKTTLLEAIRYIMGDYAGAVEINSLMQSASNADQQRAIADLLGKRFVTSSEAEEGQRLNEAKIKQLTGMGRQVGRRIYGSAFEFDPQFKLFIDANHKPVIRGTDSAIWNRIRLVQFDVSIPKHEQDRQLLEKLRSEAPGILAWAIQGCLEWQEKGHLASPTAVADAVEGYRQEMDIVAEFISDWCVLDTDCEVSSGDLYDHFLQWCEARREEPISVTAFGHRLGKLAFEGVRSAGIRKRRGLALKRLPQQADRPEAA